MPPASPQPRFGATEGRLVRRLPGRTHTDGQPTTHAGTKSVRIPQRAALVPICIACPNRNVCRAVVSSGGRAVPAKPSPAAPPARAVAACRSRLSFRRAPDRYPRPQRQTPTRFHRWGFGDEDPGDDLLSHGLSHTTIGAGAFHFRVRNGIGWFHTAMVTRERVEGRVLSACLSTDTDRFAPERKRGDVASSGMS